MAQLFHGAANFLLSFRIESALNQREKPPVFLQQVRPDPLNVVAAPLHNFLAVLAILHPLLDALEVCLLRSFTRFVFATHPFQGCRNALHVALQGGKEDLLLLEDMIVKNQCDLLG